MRPRTGLGARGVHELRRTSYCSTCSCRINGFEVAAKVTANGSGSKIVLVSSRDGSDFGPLVHQSGARGFIPKGELSGARLAALIA